MESRKQGENEEGKEEGGDNGYDRMMTRSVWDFRANEASDTTLTACVRAHDDPGVRVRRPALGRREWRRGIPRSWAEALHAAFIKILSEVTRGIPQLIQRSRKHHLVLKSVVRIDMHAGELFIQRTCIFYRVEVSPR
jgi:hypothetical protein